jgi:hypothetical protein
MCEQVSDLVDHAEVLVIGSADPDANQVLQSASRDQVIVDLTRGALRLKANAGPGAKAQKAA